jgi:hypothetical protein
MGAMSNLSPHQFANVNDLVWKYNKTDSEQVPMEGLHGDAGPHSRGRDFQDLVETRLDHAPGHLAHITNDVSRRGVQSPIGVDHSTTPPTVSDGHTRLIAAYHSGHRRVPIVERPIGEADNKHEDRDQYGTDYDVRFPGQTRL